jgi:hypothetical protein
MEIRLKHLDENRLSVLRMIFLRTTDYTQLDLKQNEHILEQLKIANHQIYIK